MEIEQYVLEIILNGIKINNYLHCHLIYDGLNVSSSKYLQGICFTQYTTNY